MMGGWGVESLHTGVCVWSGTDENGNCYVKSREEETETNCSGQDESNETVSLSSVSSWTRCLLIYLVF